MKVSILTEKPEEVYKELQRMEVTEVVVVKSMKTVLKSPKKINLHLLEWEFDTKKDSTNNLFLKEIQAKCIELDSKSKIFVE